MKFSSFFLMLFGLLICNNISIQSQEVVNEHQRQHEEHIKVHNEHHNAFMEDRQDQPENHQHHHHYSQPHYFKVGDMYYSSTFKGLKQMIIDINEDDPELYALMLPSFKDYEKRRKTALNVGYSTAAVGGFLILGSVTFMKKTKTETSFFSPGSSFYEPPKNVKKINGAVLATGSVFLLSSWIISTILHPKEQDIYNLMNLYNKNSKEKKMQWNLGLNSTPEAPIGVGLQLSF